MKEQKSKIDHIDDMNLHLKQPETLTSILMCVNLHDHQIVN